MRSILDKKGQVNLANAPMIVMIVGFIFLLMATIAYVSDEYQDAFSLTTYTVTNETLAAALNETVQYVANVDQCEFQGFAVITLSNNTAEMVASNYTAVATTGAISLTEQGAAVYNNSVGMNITYTYQRAGIACNVTSDLQTELDDNTSIAGIVLTISLVGVILSVLIGVFVMSRRRGL